MPERQKSIEEDEEVIKRRKIQNRDAQRRFRCRKRQQEHREASCTEDTTPLPSSPMRGVCPGSSGSQSSKSASSSSSNGRSHHRGVAQEAVMTYNDTTLTPESFFLPGELGDFDLSQLGAQALEQFPSHADDQGYLGLGLHATQTLPGLYTPSASTRAPSPDDGHALLLTNSYARGLPPGGASTPPYNAVNQSQSRASQSRQNSMSDARISRNHSAAQLHASPGRSRAQTSYPKAPPSPKQGTRAPQDNDEYKPLLHIAAENGHEQFVRALIRQGVDVNERDGFGSTALSVAIMHGHGAVVRLLLENNARVDIVDDSGWTPLQHAAESGFVQCLPLLLHYGAKLDRKGRRK